VADQPPTPATTAGPRAGTVAILGRPNVGKSTLLNRIVGEKLAIVTPKPQTTRNRIMGVWNGPGGQVVFVDTPGVHAARSKLNRFMVSEAMNAIDDVDAALLVVEPRGGPPPADGMPPSELRAASEADRHILGTLGSAGKPVVLAINKVDTVRDKTSLLPLLGTWMATFPFKALVPISALKGQGVDDLVRQILDVLPPGPPLFGQDMLTDRSERFLAAELIREQLILLLRQELPFSTAVVVEGWQERGNRNDVVIDATIIVERESQKGIVVGSKGSLIREVGTRARAEITRLLGRPAHLRLEVKVDPAWTTSSDALTRVGYVSGR